ncbi:MAG: DUF4248 domain-containing protein [Bacteroidaceae bacterium]|nr:DUF4248 domain-containing protein [Bacteroidaceae bacterium]
MSTPIYSTKRQLAMAYAPGMSYESAKKRLQRWINHNPVLMHALRKTGYTNRQRNLSKEQVAIILNHIGEP